MRLSDPMLAIGPRETHTVEWMLLPQGPNCSTYWCYINKLRHDFGTDTIAVGENAGTENMLGDVSLTRYIQVLVVLHNSR